MGCSTSEPPLGGAWRSNMLLASCCCGAYESASLHKDKGTKRCWSCYVCLKSVCVWAYSRTHSLLQHGCRALEDNGVWQLHKSPADRKQFVYSMVLRNNDIDQDMFLIRPQLALSGGWCLSRTQNLKTLISPYIKHRRKHRKKSAVKTLPLLI